MELSEVTKGVGCTFAQGPRAGQARSRPGARVTQTPQPRHGAEVRSQVRRLGVSGTLPRIDLIFVCFPVLVTHCPCAQFCSDVSGYLLKF